MADSGVLGLGVERTQPTSTMARRGTVRHAFTVDLEDWYHGIPVDAGTKAAAERRLHVGTDRLLELLDRHHAKATFFCLSPTAKEHPDILRRLVAGGHDIGSHGESHDLVYEMTPERFREETRRSIRELEDCCGRPRPLLPGRLLLHHPSLPVGPRGPRRARDRVRLLDLPGSELALRHPRLLPHGR